eukprot:931375-Amphidinium_carterae.1
MLQICVFEQQNMLCSHICSNLTAVDLPHFLGGWGHLWKCCLSCTWVKNLAMEWHSPVQIGRIVGKLEASGPRVNWQPAQAQGGRTSLDVFTLL